jgi:hypothetical protein
VRLRSLLLIAFPAAAFAWLACGEALPDNGTVDPPVRDSGVDAATDAGGPDGRAPSCFGAPFTDAVLVPELSSPGDEQSVTLSNDEREVFVGTTRKEGTTDYDLYTSRRTTTEEAFPALVRADTLSSLDADYAATITSDGIIFSSQRDGGAGAPQRLFYASRVALSTSFNPTLTPLSSLDVADLSTAAPFLAPGGVLYFSRGGSENHRIMRAKRTSETMFEEPEDVEELNAGGGDTFSVVVSNDSKTIYFGTDARPGAELTDIFVATRAEPSGPFGAPVRVADPAVNTPQDDRPGFLSADGCRLYLVSNRPGGLGLKDVWLATRSPR